MHFSGEGRNVFSQSRTGSRATKEPCLKCYSQSRFSFLPDMAPQGQGKSPKVPYLGMALFHISLAILPAGDKSPVTHNSNYFLSPLSPSPLSGDRLMTSSGASQVHPVTGCSNTELAELISTVSLFRPGLCR